MKIKNLLIIITIFITFVPSVIVIFMSDLNNGKDVGLEILAMALISANVAIFVIYIVSKWSDITWEIKKIYNDSLLKNFINHDLKFKKSLSSTVIDEQAIKEIEKEFEINIH